MAQQPQQRVGRPWGPPCGPNQEIDKLVGDLRSWLDEAGLSVPALYGRLLPEHFKSGERPSLGKVREMLRGKRLTDEFAEAVADICSPNGSSVLARTERVRAGFAAANMPPAAEVPATLKASQPKESALAKSDAPEAVVSRQLVEMPKDHWSDPEDTLWLVKEFRNARESEPYCGETWLRHDVMSAAAAAWPVDALTALLLLVRDRPHRARRLCDMVGESRPPGDLFAVFRAWDKAGQKKFTKQALEYIGRSCPPKRVAEALAAFRDAGGDYVGTVQREVSENRSRRGRWAVAKALKLGGMTDYAAPLTGLSHYLRALGEM
ncbi:hypothetical protein ACFVY1_25965 [Streptomyces sp. NPDC058293]|uniref:hypothetical protein n=1 Tax=Streptomyces sp. NPDC058293 TaxID=3346429 RepID=UPI0036E78E22